MLRQRHLFYAILGIYAIAVVLYFAILPLILPEFVDGGTAATLLFEVVTLNGVLLGFYSILAVGNIEKAQKDHLRTVTKEDAAARRYLGPAGLFGWDLFLIIVMALTAFIGIVYTAILSGPTSRTVLDVPIALTFSSLFTVVLRFVFAFVIGFGFEWSDSMGTASSSR